MATLEAWKDGALVEEFTLTEARTYRVGRSEDADIPTEHPSCSRRHAEIVVNSSGRVTVTDLSLIHI